MHDYITVGIPVFAVFFAALLNQRSIDRIAADSSVNNSKLDSRIDRLDTRFDRLENKIDARFDAMQKDLREFYRTIGQHDARLDALEGKRSA